MFTDMDKQYVSDNRPLQSLIKIKALRLQIATFLDQDRLVCNANTCNCLMVESVIAMNAISPFGSVHCSLSVYLVW